MPNEMIIFDKPYTPEKIAEGRAIQWAVVSGACNKCKHKKQCENDSDFAFPQNTPCMKKKNKLIQEN